MAKKHKRPAGLDRVKWTPRVDPADVETFQAVRSLMGESARRRVSDAEVFRLAVEALAASDVLPAGVRRDLDARRQLEERKQVRRSGGR